MKGSDGVVGWLCVRCGMWYVVSRGEWIGGRQDGNADPGEGANEGDWQGRIAMRLGQRLVSVAAEAGPM